MNDVEKFYNCSELINEIDGRIDNINNRCNELEVKFPSSEYHNNVGVCAEKGYWNGQRQALYQLKHYIETTV